MLPGGSLLEAGELKDANGLQHLGLFDKIDPHRVLPPRWSPFDFSRPGEKGKLKQQTFGMAFDIKEQLLKAPPGTIPPSLKTTAVLGGASSGSGELGQGRRPAGYMGG